MIRINRHNLNINRGMKTLIILTIILISGCRPNVYNYYFYSCEEKEILKDSDIKLNRISTLDAPIDTPYVGSIYIEENKLNSYKWLNSPPKNSALIDNVESRLKYVYESGFDLILNDFTISINEGYYWEVHREKVNSFEHKLPVDLKGVLDGVQFYYYFYIKDGVINYETEMPYDFDILPLWQVMVILEGSVVVVFQRFDYRGKKSFK